jgi:hypothetical protein
LKKYPDFKANSDYSNIKYFFNHILFYSDKENEKYINFLDKNKKEIKYKNKKINANISNYKKIIASL